MEMLVFFRKKMFCSISICKNETAANEQEYDSLIKMFFCESHNVADLKFDKKTNSIDLIYIQDKTTIYIHSNI